MKYSIDTSSLIKAWNSYPPDIFPNLWESLEQLIEEGRLIAADEVLLELSAQEDRISEWAKEHSDMFVPLNEVQEDLRDLLEEYPDILKPLKSRPDADPHVIAAARVKGCTVVTEEKRGNKRKIPTACLALGIPCMNILDLFREENWTF